MIGSTFGLRLLTKPSVQMASLALLALVVLVFRALQFAHLTTQIQWGYDFSAYWEAGRLSLDQISPYQAEQLAGPYSPQQQFLYLYPPPLALLVSPLAAVVSTTYLDAAWVWAGVGAAILAVSVLELWRVERLGDRYRLLAGLRRWLLVAAAFAFPPVVGELVLGNVHLVLLGLLTLAWLGLRRSTHGGELIGGMAVGAAAMVKVFPGLLLLWFLLTRRFRAAVGFVVAAAVLAIVTLPITGLQPWLDYPTVLANLSAPSNTTDTLAPTVWLADAIGFTAARILVTLVGIGLLAWAALRLDAKGSFAVAVMVSILVAPALYHHYLALLVLPLILGLSAGVPLRWLVLAYFLMWGGQQQALGDLAWIINRGMPTAGALVLLTGLLVGRPHSIESAPSPVTAQAPA